jgi:hypothetical protein
MVSFRKIFASTLLLQLLQFFLGLGMIGELFEELQEYGFGFFAIAFDGIDARQIQIGLVVGRRSLN